MNSKRIKNIAITGIGIALFVVLSLCLQVPVFENYYLCLGYIAMIVYLYSVGTVSGTIVGVFGTILYCLLINGLRGMPGWAIANIYIGISVVAIFNTFNKTIKNRTLELIISIFWIIIDCAIGILFIKSGIEVLLYSQPLELRLVNNIYAFIADVFVISFSIPICWILDKHIKRLI